ncbi:DUF2971 domain-containing protein [Haloterrigena salinisoli]|uniref:DUF2971 domain-containing protein n=1 Tax=Haloterrigena salinisoli TaxID=3132747 RepID=UPI0030CB5C4E
MEDEKVSDWKPPSADPKATLWRYMSFSKYVSLLSRGELWFNSTKEFTDPYEGLLPKENKQELIERLMENQGKRESYATRIVNTINKYIGIYLVNCWTHKDHQSAALWDLYTNKNEGVAIKTTVGDLSTALEPNRYDFYSGLVSYKNYDEDAIPNEDPSVIFHKRQSFSHEDEYRIVVRDHEKSDNGRTPSGKYIECELDSLIQEVYVHPFADSWFCDLVEQVTSDYCLDVPVKQSSLFNDPIE